MDEISVFRLSYMYPAACLLAATLGLGLFEGDLRVAKRHCSVCMQWFSALKNDGNEITALKQQFKLQIHNLIQQSLLLLSQNTLTYSCSVALVLYGSLTM